jgi:hypothetical protein
LIGIQHDTEFSEILTPAFYYLVLFDFTDLAKPTTIRASIWRVDPLAPGFAYCMIDYYKNIKSASVSGAPFNLWPFQLKFELMRPLLIYRSLILQDNTIETRIFPGRDLPEPHPMSPLQTFRQSRNLTVDKIRSFAQDLALPLPGTGKKLQLLVAAEHAIRQQTIQQDLVIDTLARHLYWNHIERHVTSLPDAITIPLERLGLLGVA